MLEDSPPEEMVKKDDQLIGMFMGQQQYNGIEVSHIPLIISRNTPTFL
jgi:hypothetical protein